MAALVAVLASLLLLFAAFAVDLGMQRVARADMQSLADVVAMDMTRQLDGRTAQQITSSSAWSTALAQSLARNAGTVGRTPTVTASLGLFDATTGVFSPVAGSAVPDAVKVSASTAVSFAFTSGSGAAGREAVAQTESSACYEVGSYAAAVRSGRGTLLGPLLAAFNSSLNLTAVSYDGLANTSIKLSQLAIALGLGSVDQLAKASVSYRSFYLAVAEVLNSSGKVAQASIFQTLAGSVSSAGQFTLGSILSLGGGTTAALNATANVLDLLSASAFVLNGTNVLNVPLGASIPGLGSVNAAVKVVQKVSKYCGRPNTPATTATPASTSQVSASVNATLSTPNVSIPLLGSVAVGSPTGQAVSVALDVAPTTGSLTAIRCKTPMSSSEGITLRMDSGLVTTSVSVPLRVTGTLNLLGLGQVRVDIRTDAVVSTSVNPTSQPFDITVPPRQFDTPYSTGTGSLGLGATTVKTGTQVSANLVVLGVVGGAITLSSAVVDSILDPVISAVVTPLVGGLSTALVEPLSNLLGVRTAGADVIADSDPPLTCQVPALRQ